MHGPHVFFNNFRDWVIWLPSIEIYTSTTAPSNVFFCVLQPSQFSESHCLVVSFRPFMIISDPHVMQATDSFVLISSNDK